MAISNLTDLSVLDEYDYIDLYSIGKSEIGFIDQNDRVQNTEVVADLFRKFASIENFYIDEEKEIILLCFGERKIGIRMYGAETLERFFDLLKNNPDLYAKFSSQIKKLNREHEKRALKETSRKVKRENRYSRNRARVGIGLVATVVLSTGIVSYATRQRDTAKPVDIPQDSSVYELPTETTEATSSQYFEDISDSSYIYTEDTTTYTTPMPNLEEKKSIELYYSDRQFDSKATICKENYYDLIKKYSLMYGIDPKIMLAIATQERGTHSNVPDEGGAIGLMQLQVGVWENDRPDLELRAYNYETETYDVYNLPLKNMGELEYNIKYACMIFQNNMRYMHNNPVAAIQSYNYGATTLRGVIEQYCADSGKTVDEVLDDPYNLDWLPYRTNEPSGDCNYVENVLSYIGTDNEFVMKDSNKDTITFSIKGKQKARVLT